ncbi:MAG: dissimilatory sulfite reductase alpha subunit [Clostridia bacterium]|nr:dissimilatory sulfite reductase alpha subunit [Clostridia bacterium]
MKAEWQELPLCRQLMQGLYPSHVAELSQTRYPLQMYEEGLKKGVSAYDYGGYISIPEIPSGAGVRTSRRPDILPESPYLRVLGPAGGWLSADTLERLADCAEKYGNGLIHLANGGTIELYAAREKLVPLVRELNSFGLDVGSTGDDLRCLTSCCGPARCDLALVDAPALATYLGQRFIDDQQYPGFPQKCKSAVAGCPNDCIRAMMQKDHSFIGVFRDLPVINNEEFKSWLAEGGDPERLVNGCPEKALKWDGHELFLDGDTCVRCMFCINNCPAIRPGRERGVAWVVGGKYGHRGPQGPMVGYVLVPFIPLTGEEGFVYLGDIFAAFLELWSEHGRRKERIGDFVARFGPRRILRALGLKAEPQILLWPKNNAFANKQGRRGGEGNGGN